MPFSNIKRFILPQDGVFFDLLEKQADVAVSASKELSLLFKDFRGVKEKAEKIRCLEHEGDKLMHALYVELNKSLIVPMDHDDVTALGSCLDDVADLANVVAKRLVDYEIRAPSPAMIKLASLLALQSLEIKRAVCGLRSKKTYEDANQACIEINRLENEADDAYSKGVGALFKKKDAIEIIKQKEILDSIETALDKGEGAANVVCDIMMKQS